MDYSLFYLSGILFTAISSKNDKYFKNLSYRLYPLTAAKIIILLISSLSLKQKI